MQLIELLIHGRIGSSNRSNLPLKLDYRSV